MKPKYTGDALQSPRCAVGELGGEVNVQALTTYVQFATMAITAT
jgi:hypothetical protein